MSSAYGMNHFAVEEKVSVRSWITYRQYSTSTYVLNVIRAGIFERVWGPGIDSKEWIPPAYAAWRAGTITLFLLGA